MTYRRSYECDWEDCQNKIILEDFQLEESFLDGWVAVSFFHEDEDETFHFCSPGCLAEYLSKYEVDCMEPIERMDQFLLKEKLCDLDPDLLLLLIDRLRRVKKEKYENLDSLLAYLRETLYLVEKYSEV